MRGKGLGGRPPLGYDVDPVARRLVPNRTEAPLVREVFDAYMRTRSILAVVRELNVSGHVTKRWTTKDGREMGGSPFQITTVQQLLSNVIYMGKVEHAGQRYSGEHEEIVSEEIFLKTEALRKANRQERSRGPLQEAGPLLRGILRCRACEGAMVPSSTQRGERRYSYWVCSHAQKHGYDSCPRPSVAAHEMEETAFACLRKLASETPLLDGLEGLLGPTWETLFPQERARIFRAAVKQVVHDPATGSLALTLDEAGLGSLQREMAPEGAS